MSAALVVGLGLLSLAGPGVDSARADVGAPSWWDGDCDANRWNAAAASQGWSGAGAHRLGAVYLGVPVCGPRPWADGAPNVWWGKSGWGEYEWQCTELAFRFMAQVYGVAAYSANGVDVVNNYQPSAGGNLVKVANGTAGSAPQPGDVVSFSNPQSPVGHVAVVAASSVDGNGNGSVRMLSENDTADGWRTLAVTGWRLAAFGGQTPYGWLHDPAGRGVHSVQPVTPGALGSLPPARLLDTRSGLGAPPAPMVPGGTILLTVLGRGGVPSSGVSAVVLNLTVTEPTSSGYLTAYPSGAAQPATSNLNFTAGQTVPNLAVVPVGSDGKVALTNGSYGTTQVVADVAGYYVAGSPVRAGAFGEVPPARLLDTRSGLGAPASPVQPYGTLGLDVLGRAGVPATGVSAVVLNVTVTEPAARGYLTAHPGATAAPVASNLNFTAGETVPNLVVVPVGSDGRVALTNGSEGSTHLVADVAGYFVGGAPGDAGAFGPLPPTRLLDTRSGVGAPGGAVAPGRAVRLQVVGRGGVPPAGVSAVVLNVTVTEPTAGGYVTAYPGGTGMPTASNLNFVAGQTVPNLVVVPVGSDGTVSLANGSPGTVQLVADVAGYFRG